MEETSFLSIVTPTYNRAKLLGRCFQSLQRQTNKQFEWIIVDDGSEDNTAALVDSFLQQSPEMCITYVRKDNGGKHTALNASHAHLHGNYVLILDSDDILVDTAVNDVLNAWLPYQGNADIGAVVMLKGKAPDDPIAYVKQADRPVDLMKCKRICVHGGDCCEVLRTELFKQFPFPVYPGEKFISEGVLWKKVSQEHLYVYINKVIYICDYLEDGLTRSGRAMRIKSPLGGMLNSSLNMDPRNDLKTRVKNGMLYSCYGYFAGLHAKAILKWDPSYCGLKIFCLIPGFFQYRMWKRLYT